MPTPEDEVRALRQAILDAAPDPATDPADIAQVDREALDAMATGRIEPPAPEVRVRLSGDGAVSHDIAVETATRILGTLQGILTAVGFVVRRTAPKGKRGTRVPVARATELRLSPTIGSGSVVFFLRGRAESVSGNELAGTTATNTLLDVAVSRLFTILDKADQDLGADVGVLSEEIRRYGVMTAARLGALAEEVVAKGVEVDLGWRSPDGHRRSVQMKQRSAQAIKDAVQSNRERVSREQVVGVLHTVSDGTDLIRLTPEGEKAIRMRVEPELGLTLGPLLGKRVIATIETTVIWHVASGREHLDRRLVSAEPAAP